MQESTGFSPAELVFGHNVHGPLRMLREKYLSETASSNQNVLDYVSSFRERLHKACKTTCSPLSVFQGKIKNKFHRTAVQRKFEVGYKVLSILLIPGSTLLAKFCCPYDIKKKLSDIPDHQRKSCVCHTIQ